MHRSMPMKKCFCYCKAENNIIHKPTNMSRILHEIPRHTVVQTLLYSTSAAKASVLRRHSTQIIHIKYNVTKNNYN